jgi:DNA-binding MarR family transcriptional regulator
MAKSRDTSKGSVWPLFLTTYAVLVERIEARFAGAGLPPLGWYDVLWGLARAPEQRLRMSELAEKAVLSRSNLTRLVDRLEDAGLVRRERSEEDRRGAYAVLTAAGKAMRERMWPLYSQAIAELFESHLTPAQAEVMAQAFREMLDAARPPPSAEESARPAGQEAAGEGE